MAAGLPVVATDVGGNRQLVGSGRHGLLCRSEDVEGMADTLGTLLDAPDRLSEARAAVPEYVARYGWERIAQEYASLGDEVARAAWVLDGRRAGREGAEGRT